MLALFYSTGIRLSELRNIKITDIDNKRMVILIRQGKGFKDRIVPLYEKVLILLRQYYAMECVKPVSYLFTGRFLHKPINSRAVQDFLTKAGRRAGIKKQVSPHIIRHTMATHLLDKGTNIRQIQAILGHKSLHTTQGYTHLAKDYLKSVPNLIESLNEEKHDEE